MTTSGNGLCDYSVKVLAEELAYNKSLKQFKMFIIEKPLDPKYKVVASYSRSLVAMVTGWIYRNLKALRGLGEVALG